MRQELTFSILSAQTAFTITGYDSIYTIPLVKLGKGIWSKTVRE